MAVPAITVVIPAYNRAETVGAAIASVLAQDFADFEVVVVDDGSGDATAAVVAATDDPRVGCLRLPDNRGVCAARNAGIRAASAPLIAFLDSDDYFLPNKLGFVVRFFAEHPDIDVLLDSFEVVYPPSMGKAAAARRNPDLLDSTAVERAVFRRDLWKATPALSARREALFAAGLFDESLRRRVDMDIVLRLVRSARCASTSTVLWCKRWTDDSISAAAHTYIPAVLAICSRHPDYLARREWRAGLARDISRHLLRQAGRGRFGLLARDWRQLRECFGATEALRLCGEGAAEIARRALDRGRRAG